MNLLYCIYTLVIFSWYQGWQADDQTACLSDRVYPYLFSQVSSLQGQKINDPYLTEGISLVVSSNILWFQKPHGRLTWALMLGLLSTEQDPLVQVSDHKHYNKAVTLSKSKSLLGPLNVVTCMTWQTYRTDTQTAPFMQMMAYTEILSAVITHCLCSRRHLFADTFTYFLEGSLNALFVHQQHDFQIH